MEWIAPSAAAAVLLIGGAVAAYMTIYKGKVEAVKAMRDGVIASWEQITAELQKQHQTCLERTVRLESQVDFLQLAISKLHLESSTIRNEMSALRQQLIVRETDRVEQRRQIGDLEKKVDEVKKTDPAAIAEALAPKLVQAMATTTPVPVVIIPDLDAPPIPVKETPS